MDYKTLYENTKRELETLRLEHQDLLAEVKHHHALMGKLINPRWKESIKKMYTIRVDCLSYVTTKEDLVDIFAKYGDIGDICIPFNKKTGDPRGFAFVRFFYEHDALAAIEMTDGRSVINGKTISVSPDTHKRS